MLRQTRNPYLQRLYLGIGLLFVLYTLAACSIAPKKIPDAAIAEIDTAIGEMAEKRRFSGTILIAQDDQVLLSKGYGQADLESGKPNTPETRFRIGSITKGFTATAILILQEQGKLSVQEHVCAYIPDCPAAWQAITIHHLLTHTSGLSDRTFFTEILPGRHEEHFTPGALIDLFRDVPLDFEPGREYRYSNTGYMLLGYMLEQVSGQAYEAFLQEHIFAPLNLANTGYDHMVNEVATCYSSYGDKARFYDTSFMYSAGGLYSTVEDLYRWLQALRTDSYFSQAAFAALFTPFVSIPSEDTYVLDAYGQETNYGYGWIIGETDHHRLVGHDGSYFGFFGIQRYYPDDHITIIMLSNMDYWAAPSAFTLPGKIIFEKE
jgi:CubicO group peptidase (beta-lactamase class C family)